MSRSPSLASALSVTVLSTILLGGTCSDGGGGDKGGCDGSCDPSGLFLTAAEVEAIAARAVAEATANGVDATIAVVDRVGNVLTVVQTPGAVGATFKIDGGRDVLTGLDGLDGPTTGGALQATLAAISKAGTGAYLSSQGNAFSTRTASQIVQENFNPGENFRGGGPLFGVQFSQLPCGDFVRRQSVDGTLGPKRLPLGFAADPGGLPLYKSGVPVGGVGVESDGIYTADLVITDFDTSLDERIASAATLGVGTSFAAPADRRADRIAVDGRTLRFADDENVRSTAAEALALIPLTAAVTIPVVDGFFDPGVDSFQEGQALQAPGSGIERDDASFTDASGDAISVEFYSDGAGMNLFPPIDSLDPLPGAAGGMTQIEVMAVLQEALRVANRARGQIRRPQGSSARVNFSIVDISGTILGFIRTLDAPMFGADVSLQKARTAVFFSRTDAAANLMNAAPPVGLGMGRFLPAADYLAAAQAFFGDPTVLTDGTAFSDRAGGNLSRPFFPDGINGRPNGPFSRPFADWSVFSTGLQLDTSADGILDVLTGANPARTQCTPSPELDGVPNGFQIFPGSVPIYRGSLLVGGIGISGDGVDQDDMIAFLGVHNAAQLPGIGINNAPVAMRADQISVNGVQLRYVSCPPKPFLNSNEQNVCAGK